MADTQPTRAKYCPRCSVMNLLETEECRYCGYRFRSVAAQPPPDEGFNRTQMFMLPSLPQRSTAASPPHLTRRRARLIYLLGMLRNATPLLLLILSAGLLCWAIASGWLKH